MKTLDVGEKQKVQYCIPLWLRDEQVKSNLKKVSGRLDTDFSDKTDPIAVVCFGPSLKHTWEQVKEFKYIISCSGSHKFLLEHGIVPTYHLEVDPREHKVPLLGPPHANVEYLIASTCSPKLLDALEGFNVKLWHVFSEEAEVNRLLPPNEWAVTGGCAAGLRAMSMARFLGFKDLHVFGMDGNADPVENTLHGAEHPNETKQRFTTEYNGKTYQTIPGFLEAARETFHELDMLVDVQVKFYGEGLVQEMAKNYVRKPIPKGCAIVAFNKPATISEEYRQQNAQLHETNLFYGVGGGKYANAIMDLCNTLKTTSVLDYGCGKGYLSKELKFPIWEYDPAIPGKETAPRPADIVVCTDVLEHIEPDKLGFVLGDLARCTKQVGYFVICTCKASKTLPDGRNTHLIVKDVKWWKKELEKYFTLGKLIETGPLIHAIVGPKVDTEGKAIKKRPRADQVMAIKAPV